MNFENITILNNYIEKLRKSNIHPTTVNGELKILKIFLKHLNDKTVKNVESIDIQEWQIKLFNEGKQVSTINRYVKVVKKFLKFLNINIETTLIEKDKNNEIRVIEPNLVKLIYEVLYTSKEKAIVSLFLETGLKTSEVVNLKMKNIIDETVLLSPTKPIRVINLNDISKQYLWEYINSIPLLSNEDFIFFTGLINKPRKLTYPMLNYMFKNINERITKFRKLPFPITPQVLRNTFIYNQIIKGVPFYLIKNHLGLKNEHVIKEISNRIKRKEKLILNLTKCSKCGLELLPHMKVCPNCFAGLENLICKKCKNPINY
ncbi:MAG: tyrosine-type recombinase/integrase, partial [Candidatus Odinarchaeia archaeon]